MSDLSIEQLKKAVELFREMREASRANLTSPSGVMRIIVSEYAPAPFLLKYPRKGPYFRRRLKKLQGDPNNWSKPEYFIIDGSILAHPSVVHLLHAAMAPKHPLPRV